MTLVDAGRDADGTHSRDTRAACRSLRPRIPNNSIRDSADTGVSVTNDSLLKLKPVKHEQNSTAKLILLAV